MTRSHEVSALLVAVMSAGIGCSGADQGSGPSSPVAGAGVAAASGGGAGGMPAAGAAGIPMGGAAGTIAGGGGKPMTGGTGGSGAGGTTAGAGGMTGGAGRGSSGAGGAAGAAGSGSVEELECNTSAPDEFQADPDVGGGGATYTDSPHFRIYGASAAQRDAAIDALEAAYSCFVETLCWRSSGLSIRDDANDGPYYKMNIYGVSSLGGAAGQMFSDAAAGASYLRVINGSVADPRVTVHEYGHSLAYYEMGWIDQTRTGAWWETVANFVADTLMTSPICEAARTRFGQSKGDTIIDLNKVIGSSHQVIVDGSAGSGNYYQAWPFLTYLTNNPDRYAGLGLTALREMFRRHMGNNETPLHVLERVTSPIRVQKIVGRYWAHMAYLDIGHEQAQQAFMNRRSSLNFANLDSTGSGTYRVKASRQPRYFGSNIIPLTGSGNVTVQVTSGDPFTATLAVRASSGSVRYVDLENGSGGTTVASGEEASLVVVNTPNALYQYDPFNISGDAARGLDYQVQLTGAMVVL